MIHNNETPTCMADLLLRAYAKLNVTLAITGKQADGYHLLDSLFVPVTLWDDISVVPSDVFSVTYLDEQNQVMVVEGCLIRKAYDALLEQCPNLKPVTINVVKRIPIGAGLGGGSSDAASALLACCRLFELGLSVDALHHVAKSVGADVPFFLEAGPARVTGIGDIISPVTIQADIDTWWFVLVFPGESVSTKHVYDRLTPHEYSTLSTETVLPWAGQQDVMTYICAHANDLQKSAISLAPVIGICLEELLNQPDCIVARMTGSGSCCFGMFENKESAKKAQQHIIGNHPSWQTWVVKPI